MLPELTVIKKKKKKLKCYLVVYTTMNHFSIRLWRAVKNDFIQQPAMTSSVVGWSKSSEALPKDKLVPIKGSWSLFGGLLPLWSTAAFWIPMKPLHLRSMLSKSVRCTENCNACSQHWSTERVQFFSETMPDLTLHNQHFKSWMNRAVKFCVICHIHVRSSQLTTTPSSISTAFCREMLV